MNEHVPSRVQARLLQAPPSRTAVRSSLVAALADIDTSWAYGAQILVASLGGGSTKVSRMVAEEVAGALTAGASPEQVGIATTASQLCEYFGARRDEARAAAPTGRIMLRSSCLADGVAATGGWLLPTGLVVVGEWHHSLLLGHSAILDALTDLLDPLAPTPRATSILQRVYEGHLLLSPDLCVACGPCAGSAALTLIVGESDTEVEAAAAARAGRNPNTLPQLAFIARREAGRALEPGAALQARARMAALSEAHLLSEAWADAGRLPRNSRRIAEAAARRLPGRRP